MLSDSINTLSLLRCFKQSCINRYLGIAKEFSLEFMPHKQTLSLARRSERERKIYNKSSCDMCVQVKNSSRELFTPNFSFNATWSEFYRLPCALHVESFNSAASPALANFCPFNFLPWRAWWMTLPWVLARHLRTLRNWTERLDRLKSRVEIQPLAEQEDSVVIGLYHDWMDI